MLEKSSRHWRTLHFPCFLSLITFVLSSRKNYFLNSRMNTRQILYYVWKIKSVNRSRFIQCKILMSVSNAKIYFIKLYIHSLKGSIFFFLFSQCLCVRASSHINIGNFSVCKCNDRFNWKMIQNRFYPQRGTFPHTTTEDLCNRVICFK